MTGILFLFGVGFFLCYGLYQWGDAGTALSAAAREVTKTLPAVTETLQQTTETLGQAEDTIHAVQPVLSHLDATVVGLNRPCIPGPCGLLLDSAKTLGTIRGTFGQIEIAANHEDRNLSTLDTQEATLFTDFHSLAIYGNSFVEHGTTTEDDLDAILKGPSIHSTLDNTATITGNFAATTTDFQNRFHAILYPQPCHTAGCRVAKIFTIVKDGSQLLEPAYFGSELWNAVKK